MATPMRLCRAQHERGSLLQSRKSQQPLGSRHVESNVLDQGHRFFSMESGWFGSLKTHPMNSNDHGFIFHNGGYNNLYN